MKFFIDKPNLAKKKKKKLTIGRGVGGGVARVSNFFFLFQKNPSLFEGVKVMEDWLV